MTIWISDAFGQRLHLEIDPEDCELLLDLNEAKIGELFGHLRKYVQFKADDKRIRTRRLLNK